MARTKKHTKNILISSGRRNISNIANQRLYSPKKTNKYIYPHSIKISPLKQFDNIQDNRLYSPQVFIKSAKSNLHTLKVNTQNRIAFSHPKTNILCVRRKIRKEVILALGRGGKNSRPRFSNNSKISCKG